MGNCFSSSSTPPKTLPIDSIFSLPLVPPWHPDDGENAGSGFASGAIDLGGGLEVRQISIFNGIWATAEGGPGNLGASFYEPISLPEGCFVLGYFCQPNSKALFGFVLAGKNRGSAGVKEALKKPVDYTLVWSSESSKIIKHGNGYIWSPVPRKGYRAVGHVVTTSPEKPSVDRIRCVRSDLTEECEKETWIWGPTESRDENGFNVYSCRPKNRGITATGVSTGVFLALPPADANSPPPPLFCLKNLNSISSAMPDLPQIDALFEAYSPIIYFHPKEKYLPSSVDWFFSGGALLYDKSDESKPIPIESDGSNLPQGGSNDGQFWLNLPADEEAKEKLKKGDLQSSKVYLHVKPMIGGIFTDIAIWIFYPFNGPATAKLGPVDIPFNRVGEHIGDWEHITLRISNFTGELWRVYFAQHSEGEWVDAPSLEFENGNKVVVYSSLNGHASYSTAGLVMQGTAEIGIWNETMKSGLVVDAGENYAVVAAEYLGVTEPPWVNYAREWGPRIEYSIAEEFERSVENFLVPGWWKEGFREFVKKLPDEILGEEGPTGPKMKNSWNGDEP